MDAPLHFGVTPATIDQYPVRRLTGSAWVVQINIDRPQQLITVANLGAVVREFATGESLILQTNWSDFAHETKYRMNCPGSVGNWPIGVWIGA